MNDFFIYLILFLVFALFDFIAKKRKQAQRRGPQPNQPQLPAEPTQTTKPDDELEEALRQIGEALGMPVPEKKPEPKPLPPAQEKVERDYHGQVIVRQPTPPPDFHEQGFEDRPPYRNRPAPREEAFEQRPAYKNRPAPQEDAFEARPQEAFASWEQAFEDRPSPMRGASLPVPSRPIVPKAASAPIAVPATPSASDTPHPMQDDLQNLLRDPQQARQAFLLSEVFGPPKSLRR